MKLMVLRRTILAGATGVVLALIVALGAGPVAADKDGNDPGTDQSAWPAPIVPGAGNYAPGYGPPVYSYYPPGYAPPGVVAYAQGSVYGPGACGGGACGYTAAGPIVGYGPNGSTLVYDVQGGTIDAYTYAANGSVCEADTRGQCVRDGTRPGP